MPVYNHADLSRNVAIVVALFLTAISTSAVAREFCAAEVLPSRALGEETKAIEQTRAGAIDLNRSNMALIA